MVLLPFGINLNPLLNYEPYGKKGDKTGSIFRY